MTLKQEKRAKPAMSGATVSVSEVAVRASARAENALAAADAKVVKMLATANAKAQKIVERAHAKASKIDEKAQARKRAVAEKAQKKAEKIQKTAADAVLKEKKQYKVRNWKDYNESLRKRGAISLYLSPELIAEWRKVHKKKVVGQRQYPDSVIEMCLVVHFMYRLPLRQVQGYVRDLLDKMGHGTLPVPDYSTICRRQSSIFVGQSLDYDETGDIHIALDSTGLKVYGEGEWKVRQHGYGKHRTWMKLHIAINVLTQRIVAAVLTDNTQHDGTVAIDLLTGKVEKLASFRGDGAYDGGGVRELLGENTVQIIPPPENAVLHPDSAKKPLPAHLKQRNDAVQAIEENGRAEWKKESGYHVRSLNEVVMFRYKNTFGDRLQARKFENQLTEVLLKCKVLNIFVETGLPVSVIAA
jgi:hypothetical protein